MTVDRKHENGNPVSVPDDGKNGDPPAPSNFLGRLSRLDLQQPAYTVECNLRGEDAAKNLTELGGTVYSWVAPPPVRKFQIDASFGGGERV